MKKLAILMCMILLPPSLWGCGNKTDDFTEPVKFYYEKKDISYNSEFGVLEPEVREGAGFQGNATAFMHAYLRGPESDSLQGIIPSDVYLVSCTIDGDAAYITLSSQFANLTGMKLTTACSAVLRSLHDYTGIDTLTIRAKDQKLEDQDEIVMTMDDIVLIDTVIIDE